jgi:hypothetical protein
LSATNGDAVAGGFPGVDGTITIQPRRSRPPGGAPDAEALCRLGRPRGEYRPTKGVKLFAQIDDVFDRKYRTAAQLGAAGFK